MAPLVRQALKDRKLAPHVRKVEESKVMTDLAGVVAEEILSGKRPTDGGELGDMKTALERLAPFFKTKVERLARVKASLVTKNSATSSPMETRSGHPIPVHRYLPRCPSWPSWQASR